MSYTLEETNFPFSHFHLSLITPSAAHSHTLVGSYDIPFPSRRSNMPEPPKKRFKERGGSEEGKGETIKTFSLSFFPFAYSLNISLLSSLKSLFAKNGLAPFSRFGQSNPRMSTLVCLFPFLSNCDQNSLLARKQTKCSSTASEHGCRHGTPYAH